MLDDLLLSLIALFTSCVAGVLGMGGGLLLIACMPGFVPTQALIPIHGTVQLSSNLSRALFSWKHIHWAPAAAFCLGSLLGVILAYPFMSLVNWQYLPLLIGLFILLITWGPSLKVSKKIPGQFVSLGFIQGGLGLIVGATGPLGSALLIRRGLARDSLVATNATFMTMGHLAKILLFALSGFVFSAYWKLLLMMCLASVVGSWLGGRIRPYLPEANFQRLFKWLITALAIRMICIASFSLW